MCGREIPLRASIEVKIEGAIMRLCPSCYARYSMGKGKPKGEPQTTLQPKQQTIQKPQARQQRGSAKKEKIERYEVVKDYADRIRMAREAMGLSTRDLANLIKESENIVKRIESGRLTPTIDLARRIENALKIQLVVPSVDQELEELGGKTPERPGKLDITLGDVIQLKKKE